MSFGTRLRLERERSGLNQVKFARLMGTTAVQQSLYEYDKRQLRGAYLARLASEGVDVLFVLTGNHSAGGHMPPEVDQLLSAFASLSPELQRSIVTFARAMAAAIH